MISLTVEKFSCIDRARLELGALTLLIGPQASGKSVLSKLIHFFENSLLSAVRYLDTKASFDSYIDQVTNDFRRYFPPSAWGQARFNIVYQAGPIEFQIQRRGNRKSEKLSVHIAEAWRDIYDRTISIYTDGRASQSAEGVEEAVGDPYQHLYNAQNYYRKKLQSLLGEDFVAFQLFVPAGRSFFTSLGKAIAVFEHGGMLDPVTINFGRYFASARDRSSGRLFLRHDRSDPHHEKLTRELFGGSIKFERDREYVETADGRVVPFSALSSGQQELLPLWLTVEHFGALRDRQQLVYIEEPEAHLFPSAQSALIKYLMRMVSQRQSLNRLLITTHSPYMLAQINNLLKAGQIGRLRTKSEVVESFIPREYWLRPNSTRAYAIEDRTLVSIVDEDGLIDGIYMDKISGAMAEEFDKLLSIEFR